MAKLKYTPTRKEEALRVDLAIARGQLTWYFIILMWALNRIESTPAALLSLIKDKVHAMRKEFPHG